MSLIKTGQIIFRINNIHSVKLTKRRFIINNPNYPWKLQINFIYSLL